MHTTTFIPLIISHNQEDPKCPHCHNPENIKSVCRNCGHEYAEEEGGWPEWLAILVIVLGVVLVIIIGFIILEWIHGGETLIFYIKKALGFISALFKRIW